MVKDILAAFDLEEDTLAQIHRTAARQLHRLAVEEEVLARMLDFLSDADDEITDKLVLEKEKIDSQEAHDIISENNVASGAPNFSSGPTDAIQALQAKSETEIAEFPPRKLGKRGKRTRQASVRDRELAESGDVVRRVPKRRAQNSRKKKW